MPCPAGSTAPAPPRRRRPGSAPGLRPGSRPGGCRAPAAGEILGGSGVLAGPVPSPCCAHQPYLHHQLAARHLQQAAQSHAHQDVWGWFRTEEQHNFPSSPGDGDSTVPLPPSPSEATQASSTRGFSIVPASPGRHSLFPSFPRADPKGPALTLIPGWILPSSRSPGSRDWPQNSPDLSPQHPNPQHRVPKGY